MCQHLQMTLFSRILSFHRSLIPLKRFHLGDVSFCLEQIQMPIPHTRVANIKLRPLSLQKGRMARMVAFARMYRSTLDTRNCTVHRGRKRVFFYYVQRNGKRCKSVNQRPITARRRRAFSRRVRITHSMKHVSLSFCLENISISRIRQP